MHAVHLPEPEESAQVAAAGPHPVARAEVGGPVLHEHQAARGGRVPLVHHVCQELGVAGRAAEQHPRVHEVQPRLADPQAPRRVLHAAGVGMAGAGLPLQGQPLLLWVAWKGNKAKEKIGRWVW